MLSDKRKISIGLLLSVVVAPVLLAGCAGVQLSPEAERVKIYDMRDKPNQQPKFEYDSLGEIVGEDGSGCGLFGSTGDADTAHAMLKESAAKLGADSVLLTYKEVPHMSGMCFSNNYILKGTAAKRWLGFYVNPEELQPMAQRVTIHKSYDQTWSALVDYISSSFFKINTYEKDSGLMTLDFSEAEISKYVDCGTLEYRTWDNILKRTAPYAKEFQDRMKLNGQLNLRVKAEADGTTSLFVNSSYHVTIQTETNSGTRTSTWDFPTRKSATTEVVVNAKTNQTESRTCQSTNIAEKYVLNGVSALIKN